MSVIKPAIISFSPDTGAVTGNPDLTDVAVLVLAGTAAAGTTVEILNGTSLLGTAAANSSGQWTFTTPSLGAGLFNVSLTAVDTDTSGDVSAASSALNVTIDTLTPSAPIILGVSPTSGAASALTTTAEQLTLTGDALAGATVTVYDGTKDLGTTTANAQGVWSFTTGATLSDGSHSFAATATSPAGATSALSAAEAVTITSGISSFSSITDQWSTPIYVGGSPYFVENANTNGNAPWALTELNDDTLQFTLKPGDWWADNDSARTEISGASLLPENSTLNISYDMTVQPGLADTGLAWQILGQLHADDNAAVIQTMSADYPILAFHLVGAGANGSGDYLAIGAFYLPSGSTTPAQIEAAGNAYDGYLYLSSQPIVRGEAYAIQVEGSFQDNSNGFLEIWINGTQVVNYHGPLGYGTSTYWKEGVYEGWTPTQTITVDYANTTVTTSPSAPIITGDVANGNRAMLSGSAEANSTVSIYDGSTLLGTTTATSGGVWTYMSSPLSTGAHSITATAEDSAGKISAASIASPVTISASTGPVVTAVTSSTVSGEALVGAAITFTVTMSSAVTVSGVPQLTLNDGGVATYAKGSGTNTLTFNYTVGAKDSSVAGLAVTGLSLPNGASITDSSNNSAILTGANQTFSAITVDTTPVSAPVFVSYTSNSNGSITIQGTAAPNTTVYETQYVADGDDGLSLIGTASVSASGAWTYTTPSLINNTWNGFTAYDSNSLGDVSTTVTNNGSGVSTKDLPSPVILSNDVNGAVVTLTGVIPSTYGSYGPAGATVLIFDGGNKIGSATTTTDGQFSFTTSSLTNGVHTFTVESQNSSGVSAPSIPISITITAGANPPPTNSPVTVAYYLANTATLDAAGNVQISDTAANVSSAIDTLNADSHIASITLTGTPTLSLTVAQALDDTHALSAITNANYGVAVTDTGANVSANFDALNADTHVTAINSADGTQTLTLTLTQILNDTRALSILDPFTITVMDPAVDFETLTTAEISAFAGYGVTLLDATGTDVSLSLAQRKALGAAGISVQQVFSSGTVEVVSYSANGNTSSVEYQGITGQLYTSYTVYYGSNGKPASASYSNGMTETWTYNANGSFSTSFAGVTGALYTSYTVNFSSTGATLSASYNDGMSEVWTYNADGSYDVACSGVKNSSYKAYEIVLNTAHAYVVKDYDLTTGAGVLDVVYNGLTTSSGSGSLSVTTGSDTFSLNPHTTETINATGYSSEDFKFDSGFGHTSLTGFVVGGSGADVLSLQMSAFSGLSATNTAAQNASILLSNHAMAQSGSNVTFTDTAGDVLTLMGVTTTALTQNASSAFKFF